MLIVIDPLFAIFGIKTSHIGGGLAGGGMRFLLAGGSWRQAVVFVTAGVLASGYLTPGAYYMLTHYAPSFADPGVEGSVGFLVGLTAMLICEGFLALVKKWSEAPFIPSVSAILNFFKRPGQP